MSRSARLEGSDHALRKTGRGDSSGSTGFFGVQLTVEGGQLRFKAAVEVAFPKYDGTSIINTITHGKFERTDTDRWKACSYSFSSSSYSHKRPRLSVPQRLWIQVNASALVHLSSLNRSRTRFFNAGSGSDEGRGRKTKMLPWADRVGHVDFRASLCDLILRAGTR